MTVKEFIDCLRAAVEDENKEIVFVTKGTIYHKEEMYGHYYGDIVFPVEVDGLALFDEVCEKKNIVAVKLEV